MNPATPCDPIEGAHCSSCQGSCPASLSSGLPVSMARVGEAGTIVSVSGKEDVRKYLAELGFTPGTHVKAICQAGGNMILDVKGSKIAIDRHMANRIMFCPAS